MDNSAETKLVEARDEIEMLYQILGWIHDEATAPVASLMVAESRLHIITRYSQDARNKVKTLMDAAKALTNGKDGQT